LAAVQGQDGHDAGEHGEHDQDVAEHFAKARQWLTRKEGMLSGP
jgi:hypothetical protein